MKFLSRKTLIAFGLVAGLAPIAAYAAVNVGDKLPTAELDLVAELEAQGYAVLELEREDDNLEVEVSKDGIETEIIIGEKDGVVVEIELED